MKRVLFCLAAFALVLVASAPVRAGVIGVTSRAALAGTDYVEWGTNIPTSTTQPVSWTATSNLGAPVGVTHGNPSGTFYGLQQSFGGWSGNFAPGDNLLYNGAAFTGQRGSVTLSFATPVAAVGAQIQSDFYGAFTATLSAFDSQGNQIFTESGVSNGNADNSAIFLGVASTLADISSIVYSTVDMSGNAQDDDFAINRLDFRAQPLGVPEPASIALLGIGALSMIGYRLKKRKS